MKSGTAEIISTTMIISIFRQNSRAAQSLLVLCAAWPRLVICVDFLLGSWGELFTSGYGRLLIIKASLFALLMGLAGLNKFRFGPALSRGEDRGLAGLKTAIRIEFGLILAVLTVTAFLTALFSPDV